MKGFQQRKQKIVRGSYKGRRARALCPGKKGKAAGEQKRRAATGKSTKRKPPKKGKKLDRSHNSLCGVEKKGKQSTKGE